VNGRPAGSLRRGALFLALAAAACGPSGMGDPCAHDPAFDRSGLVSVSARVPEPALRRDLDRAGLAALAGHNDRGMILQGLTISDDRVSIKTGWRSAGGARGACAWLESVAVDMSPASVTIFVPSEFPPDSCEDWAVLEHERAHARTHRERLEAAAADLKAALEAARWLPARGNPLAVKDRVEAEEEIEGRLRRVVDPAFERFRESLKAAQAQLDTPASYAWSRRRCANWR
jgi:hypothetical protein